VRNGWSWFRVCRPARPGRSYADDRLEVFIGSGDTHKADVRYAGEARRSAGLNGIAREVAEIRPAPRPKEEPLLDLSGTLPYLALQQMFDPFFPAHDLEYYWKSMYLAELGEEVTRTIAEHVAARPSTRSMVGTWALGGALGRRDDEAGVASVGGAPYLIEILASWADPAEAEANIGWARAFFDAMRPHGTGRTNVNFPGLGDDAEFGRVAFGDAWDRLVGVKRKYDPKNRGPAIRSPPRRRSCRPPRSRRKSSGCCSLCDIARQSS
jgi:hypothetical protein